MPQSLGCSLGGLKALGQFRIRAQRSAHRSLPEAVVTVSVTTGHSIEPPVGQSCLLRSTGHPDHPGILTTLFESDRPQIDCCGGTSGDKNAMSCQECAISGPDRPDRGLGCLHVVDAAVVLVDQHYLTAAEAGTLIVSGWNLAQISPDRSELRMIV